VASSFFLFSLLFLGCFLFVFGAVLGVLSLNSDIVICTLLAPTRACACLVSVRAGRPSIRNQLPARQLDLSSTAHSQPGISPREQKQHVQPGPTTPSTPRRYLQPAPRRLSPPRQSRPTRAAPRRRAPHCPVPVAGGGKRRTQRGYRFGCPKTATHAPSLDSARTTCSAHVSTQVEYIPLRKLRAERCAVPPQESISTYSRGGGVHIERSTVG